MPFMANLSCYLLKISINGVSISIGAAVGFRLDSLLKLADTRAADNKMTLMHYLCKVWLCFDPLWLSSLWFILEIAALVLFLLSIVGFIVQYGRNFCHNC